MRSRRRFAPKMCSARSFGEFKASLVGAAGSSPRDCILFKRSCRQPKHEKRQAFHASPPICSHPWRMTLLRTAESVSERCTVTDGIARTESRPQLSVVAHEMNTNFRADEEVMEYIKL